MTGKPITSQYEERSEQVHRGRTIAFVQAAFSGFVLLTLIILVIQNPGWQTYSIFGGFSLALLGSLLGLYLILKNRVGFGVGLIILTYQIAIIVIALFVSELGVPASVAILLVTIISASSIFPPRHAIIGILMAIAGSVIAGVSSQLNLVQQISIPGIQPTALGLTGLLIVIYLVLLIRREIVATLQMRLILAFLAIVLIPLTINSIISTRTLQQTISAQANQSLTTAAVQTAQDINSFFTSNLSAVSFEARNSLLQQYFRLSPDKRKGSQEEQQVLAAMMGFKSHDLTIISSYGILDLTGMDIIDTDQSLLGRDFSQTSYFLQPVKTGAPFASSVEFWPQTNAPYIYFSSPIRDDHGLLIGVLRARFNAVVLQQLLIKNQGLAGQNSRPILFDQNHIRLADTFSPVNIYHAVSPLSNDKIVQLQTANLLPVRSKADLYTNNSDLETVLNSKNALFSVILDKSSNNIYAGALKETTHQSWIVAYVQDQTIFLAPLQAQTRTSTLNAIIIMALVVFVAIGIAQFLISPINKLTETAREIAAGNMNANVAIVSDDEIGLLGRTFNSMTNQIRTLITDLEKRVEERTQALTSQTKKMTLRASQLQTIAEVAHAATSITDLEKLLRTVTEVTSERFGFYHVGIFLLDETKEYAVLRAANSEGGQLMLARKHQLSVGQVGIVGYVTHSGQPRIATDVGQDAIFFNNPDLPLTRSEMALPLKSGESIIGALDVQSTISNAFTEEDIELFSILADQIAIAIENNRLLSETLSALANAQEIHRNYVRQEWRHEIAERRQNGYVYRNGRISINTVANIPEHLEAIKKGRIITKSPTRHLDAGSQADQLASLAVPIKLRGQVIGVLDLQDENRSRNWSAEEIALVQSVSDQIALALENARLFEQTVRRADRERKVLEITSKIRSTNDPQTMIQTAVSELQRALQATHAQVYFQDKPNLTEIDNQTSDSSIVGN